MRPVLVLPNRFPAAISLGEGQWELAQPWQFSINGIECIVPAGFVCDLYSVPFPISIFIPRDEKDNVPALVHDWLFATVGLRLTENHPSQISLDEANEALDVAMEMRRFRRSRRWSIYTGVRIGGARPWNRLKRDGYSLERPMMGSREAIARA